MNSGIRNQKKKWLNTNEVGKEGSKHASGMEEREDKPGH